MKRVFVGCKASVRRGQNCRKGKRMHVINALVHLFHVTKTGRRADHHRKSKDLTNNDMHHHRSRRPGGHNTSSIAASSTSRSDRWNSMNSLVKLEKDKRVIVWHRPERTAGKRVCGKTLKARRTSFGRTSA